MSLIDGTRLIGQSKCGNSPFEFRPFRDRFLHHCNIVPHHCFLPTENKHSAVNKQSSQNCTARAAQPHLKSAQRSAVCYYLCMKSAEPSSDLSTPGIPNLEALFVSVPTNSPAFATRPPIHASNVFLVFWWSLLGIASFFSSGSSKICPQPKSARSSHATTISRHELMARPRSQKSDEPLLTIPPEGPIQHDHSRRPTPISTAHHHSRSRP